MPELFGLCVKAETKNKVKSIEISLEQTAADEVKDQYANEYGICIHDTNEWLLVSSEVLWYRWRGENTLLPLWGRNLRGRYGRGPDTDEAHIGYKFGIVPKTRFRKRWRRHKRFWALPKKQNREKKKEGLRTAPLFLLLYSPRASPSERTTLRTHSGQGHRTLPVSMPFRSLQMVAPHFS